MTYKGYTIEQTSNGFVWFEDVYGQESDDVFPTVSAAKQNIDEYNGGACAPLVDEFNEVVM